MKPRRFIINVLLFLAGTVLLPGCICVSPAAAFTPPGGWGPAECRLPTPWCAYTTDSRGLPVPDTDCLPAAASTGYPTGPVSANLNQGSLNDGAHCGVSKSSLQPCGGYLTKTPSCTGDVGTCLPADLTCWCQLYPDDPTCGGGGGPVCDWVGDEFFCAYGGAASSLQHASQKSVEAVLRRAAGHDLPPTIRDLVRQLAGFKSVHLKARVLISEAPNPPSTTGATAITEYEYWESDGRYRIHTYLDPKLGFLGITDFAFNHLHHQMVMQEGQDLRLTLTPHDDRSVLLPVANPLFLPLAFLSPHDDKCIFCELRLADFALLKSAVVERENKRAGEHHSAPPRTGAGRFELTGGVISDKNTRYLAELDDSGKVTNVHWTTEAGSTLADLQFFDYQTAAGTQFTYPRKIQVAKSLDQAKQPWIVFRYVIDQLEFDRPIDEAVFTVPFDSMDTIVDSKNHFLKFKRTEREDFCHFPRP